MQEVQKITDDRTIPMETAVVRIQNDMQTFNGKMLQELNSVKMEVDHIKSQDRGAGTSSEGYTKAITEYKAVQELGKLTNDKSGLMAWKVRMKDALVQILKPTQLTAMMEWAEDPNIRITPRESMEDVMKKALDDHGAPSHEETWEKIGIALKPMRLHK